jgi:hypothetical protein
MGKSVFASALAVFLTRPQAEHQIGATRSLAEPSALVTNDFRAGADPQRYRRRADNRGKIFLELLTKLVTQKNLTPFRRSEMAWLIA